MRAEINDLKGKLTLTDKTKAAAGGVRDSDANTKTTGKEFQKKDEAILGRLESAIGAATSY